MKNSILDKVKDEIELVFYKEIDRINLELNKDISKSKFNKLIIKSHQTQDLLKLFDKYFENGGS